MLISPDDDAMGEGGTTDAPPLPTPPPPPLLPPPADKSARMALALAGSRPAKMRIEMEVRRWQPGALLVLDFARGESGGAGAAGLGELFVGEVWGATLVRQSGARMWCGGPGKQASTPPPFWWREANAPITRCVPGDASPHGFWIVLQPLPGSKNGGCGREGGEEPGCRRVFARPAPGYHG